MWPNHEVVEPHTLNLSHTDMGPLEDDMQRFGYDVMIGMTE